MGTKTLTDRDAISAELGQVADELVATNDQLGVLYARRLDLFRAGRALTPPITQRELAATAKVSEEAIIQVLRKAGLVDAHHAGEHTKPVAKCPECRRDTTNGK